MTGDFRERVYRAYRSSQGLAVDSSRREQPAAPYLRRLIARHVPSDRGVRILDIACGSGAALEELVRAGYTQVAGVDHSGEQVAAAHSRGGRYVTQGDIFATLEAAPAETVDVVLALDIVEHLDRDHVLGLFDLTLRALRAGGRIIVHTVNAESPFFGRARYGDVTHEGAFTQSSLSQLLTVAGYSQVRCYEDTPVVHGATSLVRAAIWKVVRSAWDVAIAAETGVAGKTLFSQNFLCVALK